MPVVEQEERVGGMVHERPEPLLAVPQRLLGLLLFGDVALDSSTRTPSPPRPVVRLETITSPPAFVRRRSSPSQSRRQEVSPDLRHGTGWTVRSSSCAAAQRLGLGNRTAPRAAAPGLDPAAQPPHHAASSAGAATRPAAHRLLGPLALGDVAVIGDDPGDARVVQEVLADGLDVPPGAVGVSQAELGRDRGSGRLRAVWKKARLASRSSGWTIGSLKTFRPIRSSGRYPSRRSIDGD